MRRIIARVGLFFIIGLVLIGPGVLFYIFEGWRGLLMIYIPMAIVSLLILAYDWCNKNFYS